MDLWEAIAARHSVRAYTEQKIEGEVREALEQVIADCNRQSGLNIQLCLEEPLAFGGMMARYGKFVGVRNYLALVGPKGGQLEELGGYWGERIALEAQRLGLNTCWVAATYKKGKAAAQVGPGEKLLMVLSIGYGQTQGVPHKGKSAAELCTGESLPDWFLRGMEAVSLAPTAMNQQKFRFSLRGKEVSATAGSGFYVKTDLGIAKCHFEIGASGADWSWAKTP